MRCRNLQKTQLSNRIGIS